MTANTWVRPRFSADVVWPVGLGCLFCLLWILVRPLGEFPLNDGWSYAYAVKTWVETGELRFTGWTSVPLIAQAIWGRLFCPGGFSFMAVRVSCLVAGILGIWGMYRLMRNAGRDRLTSGLAALTLTVNPIYLNLACTFMTDVPFAAASIWAMALWIRAFRDASRPMIWAGMGVAAVATMVRHNGLVLPAACAVAGLAYRRGSLRCSALTGLILTVLGLAFYCSWAASHLGLNPFWARQAGALFDGMDGVRLPLHVMERVGGVLLYLGLFCLPFAITRISAFRKRTVALMVAGAVPAAGALEMAGIRMPVAGNVLHRGGLGPVRLLDTTTLGLPNGPELSPCFWIAATMLAVFGVILSMAVFLRLGHGGATEPGPPAERLLMLLIVAGASAPMVLGGYFDRYLLAIMPCWLWALGSGPARTGRRKLTGLLPATCCLIMWSAFGVAATHDYFEWNRARWRLAGRISGAVPDVGAQLDGGFEWNGWHNYSPDHPADRGASQGLSWWWVEDDRYAITMGPVPGYREWGREPYRRWLPGPDGTVYVLARVTATVEE